MTALGDAPLRFLIGGVVVSAFAMLGGIFKPASFAGLFGAAPSVALGTLTLAIVKDGKTYASTECRSMIAGAIALCLYCIVVSRILVRFRISALKATVAAMPFWVVVAFSLWRIFLH